jgi:hypothetical protein
VRRVTRRNLPTASACQNDRQGKKDQDGTETANDGKLIDPKIEHWLVHRESLGQVAREIRIIAAHDAHMVGKQLQR